MFKFKACLFILVNIVGSAVNAETIDTSQILSRTLRAGSSCADWSWIGNCFWLDCNLLDCRVRTTPKVRHFHPDLLVTVQTSPSLIAWREMRTLLKDSQGRTLSLAAKALSNSNIDAGGGHGSVVKQAGNKRSLRFYEANVFGHPLEKLPLGIDKLLCKPVTKPAKPYFQSSLDFVAWRIAPIESVLTLATIPGNREIESSLGSSWGSVYPRSGFVTHPSPAKAAAVVAQRACDIVSDPKHGHVALGLEKPKGKTTPPPTLNERDVKTGIWQMISPKVDTDCALFGSADSNWDSGRIDASDSYIWNLWRPYECCKSAGQTYIGTINF